jgi:vitamin B12 transporter
MKKSIRLRARAFVPALSVLSLACGAAWGQLTSLNAELNPMVIVGSRMEQPLHDVLPSVSVITKEEIQKTNASDISDLLMGQVGLEVARTGTLGSPVSIYIRGASSSQTLVLLDGIPIMSEGAAGALSTIDMIPLNQIERIEILRGNASAIYGPGAVGGVIQLITQKKSVSGFKPFGEIFYGRFNTSSTTVGFDGGQDDVRYSLAAGHQESQGFEAISHTAYPNVNPNKNGYRGNNFRLSVTKELDAANLLGVRFMQTDKKSSFDNNYGGTAVNNYTDSAVRDWENKTQIQSVQLYSVNKITQDWRSDAVFNRTMTKQATLTDGVANMSYGTTDTAIDTVSWKNTVALNSQHTFLAGFDAANSKFDGQKQSGYPEVSAPVVKDATRKRLFAGTQSVFGAASLQLNASREMFPEAVSANTYLIGGGYRLNDKWKATVSRSTAIQAPTIGQLYDFAWGGNQNLSPERSRSTEAGLQYAADSTYMRVVAFKVDYQNLITTGNSLVNDPFWAQQRIKQLVNVQSGHNTGLEAQFTKKVDRLRFNLSVTHQTPVNDDPSLVVLNKARNFGSFDLTYALDQASEFGARVYSTSARTTLNPASEKVPTSGYSVIKLYANHHLTREWSAGISLDNAFNREYQHIAGYNTAPRSLFASLRYQSK